MLVRRLEKLSIKCPEHGKDFSLRQLCSFFLRLEVLAEYSDLKAARAMRIQSGHGGESDEGGKGEVTQATRSS